MTCPCGREADFENCCGVFLAGALPPTAEQLMRARYTAYVRGNIDFIMATAHQADGTGATDREATERWSREVEWLGLEIVATDRGGATENDGTVEFIARYRAAGRELAHHELSRFGRVDGRWMLVDAKEIKPPPVRSDKIGRNDPCSCGSGKKYKRCHG